MSVDRPEIDLVEVQLRLYADVVQHAPCVLNSDNTTRENDMQSLRERVEAIEHRNLTRSDAWWIGQHVLLIRFFKRVRSKQIVHTITPAVVTRVIDPERVEVQELDHTNNTYLWVHSFRKNRIALTHDEAVLRIDYERITNNW
jgi:hypothetical protein